LGPSEATQQNLLPPAPNVLAKWQSEQRWINTPAPLDCCSVNFVPLGCCRGNEREALWPAAAPPSCADTGVGRPAKSETATAKQASKLTCRTMLIFGISRSSLLELAHWD
jgi:hypothetical protein